MVSSINKVELQGIVGRVMSQEFPDGRKVYNISLCTNFCYSGTDGYAAITTEWHSVKMTENSPGELDWLIKGKAIHITGRLHYNKYVGGDNIEHTIPVIIADDILSIQEDER